LIYRLEPRPIGYGCQRSNGTLGMIEGLTTLIGHLPLKASTISLPTLLLEAGLILEVPEAAVHGGSGGCPLVTWDRTRWRRCRPRRTSSGGSRLGAWDFRSRSFAGKPKTRIRRSCILSGLPGFASVGNQFFEPSSDRGNHLNLLFYKI